MNLETDQAIGVDRNPIGRTDLISAGSVPPRRLGQWAIAGAVVLVICCATQESFSQENRAPVAKKAGAQPPVSVSDSSRWAMDRLTIASRGAKGERTFHGLVLDTNDPHALEFVEIRRPPGKPMSLSIRPIERNSIAKIERVDEEQRKLLAERIEHFKRHATIEAEEMRQVPLIALPEEHPKRWRFEGQWFTLTSTTDEQTTRLCVVRLGQIFRAFRQVLPPRAAPENNRIDFQLFGSLGQYYRFARSNGVNIQNRAYFSVDQNQIVAGCDLRDVDRKIAATNSKHRKQREVNLRHERQIAESITARRRKLKAEGVSDDKLKAIAITESQVWQNRRADLERRIATAERRNRTTRDQVLGEMLRALYHEAFHAYLANYVFPGEEYAVPRWLNEGLAQVFERGQLEDNALRIDAPAAPLLKRLRDDLRGPKPLRLSEILTANPESFLIAHAATESEDPVTDSSLESESARNYLYSWGVAYYLAFEEPASRSESLADYVRSDAQTLEPRRRFERLIGMPLDQFETLWRARMLGYETTP